MLVGFTIDMVGGSAFAVGVICMVFKGVGIEVDKETVAEKSVDEDRIFAVVVIPTMLNAFGGRHHVVGDHTTRAITALEGSEHDALLTEGGDDFLSHIIAAYILGTGSDLLYAMGFILCLKAKGEEDGKDERQMFHSGGMQLYFLICRGGDGVVEKGKRFVSFEGNETLWGDYISFL